MNLFNLLDIHLDPELVGQQNMQMTEVGWGL
jgi:hypothetical protein